MNKKYRKSIPALFLACLMAVCICFLSGIQETMAATTLVSQMDDIEVSPNLDRYDSFKISQTGTLKITLSGSGSCTASLYYAGTDWETSVSGDGDLIKKASFVLSSKEQSFTASASKKGVYNLVLSLNGSGTAVCNAKAYLVTGADAFTLNKNKLSIKVGQTAQLSVSGSTGKVTWSTSNNKVVKVNSNGKVTAVKAGTATITAKCGSKKATCKVTVTGQTMKMNVKKATITEGASIQLVVNGGTGTIKWKSSNIYVAQVSSDGTVTGISKGTATITAVRNGTTLKCQITVEE